LSVPDAKVVSLPTSRKLLCGVYAVIAVAALIGPWSQNAAYSDDLPNLLTTFWGETKANPASRSVTVDIVLFALAAAILMVIEARKHNVKFVWAYIVGAFIIAISVTFPLFLIAREVKIAQSDVAHLRARDTALLILMGVSTAVFVLWVDLG
jgi:hypothetical protein